jgi:hypothetical protein
MQMCFSSLMSLGEDSGKNLNSCFVEGLGRAEGGVHY